MLATTVTCMQCKSAVSWAGRCNAPESHLTVFCAPPCFSPLCCLILFWGLTVNLYHEPCLLLHCQKGHVAWPSLPSEDSRQWAPLTNRHAPRLDEGKRSAANKQSGYQCDAPNITSRSCSA
jgi:hypothetical protein